MLDIALPGSLPFLNKEPVVLAVKSALALGCDVNSVSFFDRKHYFYPDLPLGYQITQQKKPFAEKGKMNLNILDKNSKKVVQKTVNISRIQLEQDSGKSLYDNNLYSCIDLNRAGFFFFFFFSPRKCFD